MADTFKMIDTNGNGLISKEEFQEGFAIMHKDEKKSKEELDLEVELLWGKIDIDGSGQIDYTEWALGTANKDTLLTNNKLK